MTKSFPAAVSALLYKGIKRSYPFGLVLGGELLDDLLQDDAGFAELGDFVMFSGGLYVSSTICTARSRLWGGLCFVLG
jgi:hypothetical protein